MAIAIRYTVSPTACTGGNHYQLTATITGLGPDIVTNLEIPDLSVQPTNDNLRKALEVITWVVGKKYLANMKHLLVKAAIDNKQIVLDPQAIP